MSYRQLANSVVALHNKYGASIVSVRDGSNLLEKIFDLELRVAETAPTFEIIQTHLTPRQVRQAFWDLKARREWDLERGVVWTSTDSGSSYVGLGTLVHADEPMPVLTKTLVIGGEEDDGRPDRDD